MGHSRTTVLKPFATIPAVFRLLAPVAAGVVIATAVIGAAGAAPDPADSSAPESTAPPPDPGAAAFERQLAELSFGTFLAIELDLRPEVFTCTEPIASDDGEAVTCFALVAGHRVVIARSPASGATGRFEFDVVADYEIVGSDGSTPGSDPVVTGADDTAPVTFSDAERNQANVAILVFGDSLDQSAATEIGAIVEAANGSVLAVSTWRWDATTATFTIDYALNSASGLTEDESAWLTTSAMSAHWETGQPFREPAASIKPSLGLQVSGTRYTSSWELMTQVADGAISDVDWVAAATGG